LPPRSVSLIRKRLRMTKKLNKYAHTVVVLLTVATLVSGCGKKDQPPASVTPVPVTNVASQQAKAVQKPVSTSTVALTPLPATNQFDFSTKKDPFKPDIAIKVAQVSGANKKAPINVLPIHSFDVSQFKLIGIVTGAKENKAMVVDPTGKGYVLKNGMTIGKNDGRVVSIGMNGVEIIEQFKDDSGRVRKENIKITLPRKQ